MIRIDAVNNILTYSANIIYTHESHEYTILFFIHLITHDFGYSENDHHPWRHGTWHRDFGVGQARACWSSMRRWAKKPRKPIDIDQCEVVTVKVRKLLIEIWWKAEMQSWRDLKALVMRWKSWKAALDLGLAWSNLWLSSPREKLTLRTQSSYFREVTLLCHTTTSLISGETKGQMWKSFFDHKCLRVGREQMHLAHHLAFHEV